MNNFEPLNGVTPRNGIPYHHMMYTEVENIDTLFEVCDAEFNSQKEVHESFATARGEASWVRYYLLYKVQEVSIREGVYASWHMAHIVAKEIAKNWFAERNNVKENLKESK